jgi:tetratricopeptide (TPR) repeat protein
MKYIFPTLIFALSFTFSYGQNKKADSLFYVANSGIKALSEDIDSLDVSKSIAGYSEAIKINSKFWQAYRNRSRLYYRTKQFDKAVADLTLAIQYADEISTPYLHDMRAYCYYALGDYKNAITNWTIAMENFESPGLALLGRAKAEWQLGQKDKSCLDYKRAIQLDKSLIEKNDLIKCDY